MPQKNISSNVKCVMCKATHNSLHITHNQQGAVPVIAVVVGVVAVVAIGGYLLMNKSGGSGVPSLPGAASLTLNPNCKHNDPDLCKFVNNFKEHKEFKATSVTTGKEGKMEGTYEMQGEDKFHMMSSVGGKEMMNMISIGDITYTKDYSDNKWWKQKASKENSEIKDEYAKDYSSEEVEDKTTYNKEGKEACGDKQCFKYKVVNPDMGDYTEYIYFDDKEYLLRKTRTEDKEGNVTEATYAYGGVSISAPSPTKEAAEGQVVIPGGGAMPAMSESDKQEMQKAMDEAKKAQQEYDAGDYSSEDFSE